MVTGSNEVVVFLALMLGLFVVTSIVGIAAAVRGARDRRPR